MNRFFSIAALLLAAALSFGAVERSFEAKYESISGSEMSVKFTLDGIGIREVVKDGVTYSVLDYQGVKTNEKGYAELPKMSAALQLGDEYDVVISSVDGKYEEIALDHPLLPSRGTIYRNQDPSTIPYEIDPKSVVDAWYPENAAFAIDPYVFRDVRGINIYAHPVQYNAAKQTIRVYKEMTVVLKEDLSKTTNPLTIKPDYIVSSMNDVYRSMFINYDETKFTHQIGEFGEILVIYTSRDATVIQPYIEWKRQKGFKVTTSQVATGTNVATTVANAYSSNPNILYVQLVGDWADIKSNTISATTSADPTDPMLGDISGSDSYPELIVGRFSASTTADVTVQVDKAINYEKNPDMSGTWYKTGLGIGSPDGSGIGDDGEIDYAHIDIIKENKLLPYTYTTVNEAYSNPTATTVANYVNAGTGIINYCGHGDVTYWVTSSYSTTNIASSTNGSKLPFIISVACVNGAFHNSSVCFGEAWLRKSGGGAVATIMATINQPWTQPQVAQDYMNDILVGGYNYSTLPGDADYSPIASDKRTTFGAITMNGNVLMLTEDGTSSAFDTIETWTIFGDASIQVRTDTPKALTVSNTSVTVGTPFTTNVKAAGANFQNALVSLYQNGNTFSGFTDTSGNVTIPQTLVAGTAKLTVTGYNTGTTFQDVTVSTGSTPPPTPTLSSPANGSGTTDQTPTFEWSNVGGTSYTIQVDNGSGFTSPEINQTIAAVTYTPGSNLALGTYYWRVLATNSYGSSSYSSAWSFTIGTAPGAPTLASPANGSSTGDMTPTFDWSDVSGATSYTILVDNNSDFASPEISQSPSTSTYTSSTNLNYGTYYWKVLANNSYGPGAYSATWTLSIQETPMDLPFTENFDTSTIPERWTQQNSAGVTDRWTVSNTNNAGGTAYEMSAAYQSVNPGTTRLVTPPLNTSGLTSVDLSFRHMLNDYAAGATLKIQSSSDKTNWTDESWSLATASNSNVGPYVIDTTIDNNVGSVTYIAFVITGDLYQFDYWYVDNVSVTTSTPNYSPVATTVAATSVGMDAATMNGTVNANGYTTTVTFEYGLTTSYGSTVSATPGTVTGTSNTNVSAPLTGLASSSTYNFRVKAVSSEGTTYGANQTFTTEAEPVLPDPPTALAAVVNEDDVSLSWVAPATEEPDTFTDGFEAYADFALTFANWTQIDGDGGTAYGSTDADFTNEGYVGSYIIFNPSQATPALTGAWAPRTGSKYAACFAVVAADAPNNDWMITPQLLLGSSYSFSFYAKSVKMDWGGDRFKVGVSTTGTAQGDFTIISAGEYVTATGTWTNYSYDLSAYAGQTVYLAIVCVSNDTFVLAIDDVNVNNAKGQAVYAQNFENLPTEKTDNRSYGRSIYTGKDVPRADLDNQPSTARGTLGGYKVYRNGSSIATISNPATLTYSDIGLSNGDYSYYVTATYTDPTEESGPSNVEEVNVSVSVVPGTPSNVVTSIDGTNLVIDWDVATNADSYDVYSSADPYGTFSFESNIGTNKYIVSYTAAKKFYYIVSKSGTKEAPATIKLKKADVK